ncbi:nucleoside deaminase [Ornithinibacillus californiensis]|uniref:nucleoside deaminase n=1 Tax=Ornithinibacillus californiensis TaxID=161536 RepID=UPI00064DF2B9|nr:nucleoside deaminase [Ornithinibacillus californiensis]
MRWEDLSEPWKRSFVQAWDAYNNGSIPIGAVLVDREGKVIIEGRNRVHEETAPINQICSNRLAHAEMNVLLQLESNDYQHLGEAGIYSTMEPCIQCFGAIILSKVKNIYFAALDDKLAGATTLKDKHGFIDSRKLVINGPYPVLGDIQMVLRTDFLLRYEADRAEDLIAAHAIDYPIGVALGRHYFQTNKLYEVKGKREAFPKFFDEMAVRIKEMEKAHIR